MQVYEVRISTCGTQEWHQNGLLHRLDGPAVMTARGNKYWYQNGQLHRLDGPAAVWDSGAQAWHQNGLLHRLDGPAVVWTDGSLEWYIDGVCLTEEEFNKRTALKPSCGGKTVTIDGVEYTLVSK